MRLYKLALSPELFGVKYVIIPVASTDVPPFPKCISSTYPVVLLAIELANDAADVASMIGPETNLPEWVESKITLAADYLNTVKDYLSNYDASRLHEQEDDTFFKDVFGDENDDFELSAGYTKARDLIAKLRQQYRGMSDQDMEDFSKEMVLHFLDNTTAAAAAKIHFGKKGI